MNRAALISFCLFFPAICAAVYIFSRWFDPLLGYALGLLFYWVVIAGLVLWQRRTITWTEAPFWPAKPVIAVQGLLILGVIVALVIALNQGLSLPLWVIGCVALIALCNGFLEEAFWRGTILQGHPSVTQAALALFAFTGWHAALLLNTEITTTGGAIGLLGGAFVGGLVWTLARLQTGNIRFAIYGHIALNLFAFSELALRNI